jgi:hypothetical protein
MPIYAKLGATNFRAGESTSDCNEYDADQIIMKNIRRLRAKAPGTERLQAMIDAIPERIADMSKAIPNAAISNVIKSQTCWQLYARRPGNWFATN